FHYLTREQQQFIGIFIKCRGKIKDVEQELGISYPTVVRLLDEVVAALALDEPALEPEVGTLLPGADVPVISPERRRVILHHLTYARVPPSEPILPLQAEAQAGHSGALSALATQLEAEVQEEAEAEAEAEAAEDDA